MMHNMYRDFMDGMFVPSIEVTRREDNGHYVATACGLSVTHHDEIEAVNRLTEQLQAGISRGEIHPGSE